jgi:hypothetical protein
LLGCQLWRVIQEILLHGVIRQLAEVQLLVQLLVMQSAEDSTDRPQANMARVHFLTTAEVYFDHHQQDVVMVHSRVTRLLERIHILRYLVVETRSHPHKA